jgi:hypothetical protein
MHAGRSACHRVTAGQGLRAEWCPEAQGVQGGASARRCEGQQQDMRGTGHRAWGPHHMSPRTILWYAVSCDSGMVSMICLNVARPKRRSKMMDSSSRRVAVACTGARAQVSLAPGGGTRPTRRRGNREPR